MKPTSKELLFAADVCQSLADWTREHEPKATQTIAELESVSFTLQAESEAEEVVE